MTKMLTGLSMHVSPGRVVVKGREVEARGGAVVIGVDRWGTFRLSNVEASLSWWRRALVNLAYWHFTPKRATEPTSIYDDDWPDDEA